MPPYNNYPMIGSRQPPSPEAYYRSNGPMDEQLGLPPELLPLFLHAAQQQQPQQPPQGPYPGLTFGGGGGGFGGVMHDIGQGFQAAARSAMPLEQQYELQGRQANFEQEQLAQKVRAIMAQRQMEQEQQRMALDREQFGETQRHNKVLEGAKDAGTWSLAPDGTHQVNSATGEVRALGQSVAAPKEPKSKTQIDLLMDAQNPDPAISGPAKAALATDVQQKTAIAVAGRQPKEPPKPSDFQQKTSMQYRTMKPAELEMRQRGPDGQTFEDKVQNLSKTDQLNMRYGLNVMKPEWMQQYESAALGWLQSGGYVESGATVQDSEFQKRFKFYFAQPGDGKGTIKAKAQRRLQRLESFRQAGGPEVASEPPVSQQPEFQGPGKPYTDGRSGGGFIYARDPQGKLHKAPKGTALPAGWRQE